MSIMPSAFGRMLLGTGIFVGSVACDVEDLPACPGQCFEHTVAYDTPTQCLTGMAQLIDIPFTDDTPPGYRGRFCFNSSSVPQILTAIEHLQAGGPLSDLDADVVAAYVATVNAVKTNLRAECITAAPGQCINADQVCTGIAADLYEQLVVDQTCALALGGVEPVTLGPGESCVSAPIDQGTGPAEPGDHCPEASTAGDDEGVDETAGDTGMMLAPPRMRAAVGPYARSRSVAAGPTVIAVAHTQ